LFVSFGFEADVCGLKLIFPAYFLYHMAAFVFSNFNLVFF
jgi:hypothetical protein